MQQFESMQHQNYKRSIGYEYDSVPSEASVANGGEVPRVRWLRYEFSSATLERAPPGDIVDSFDSWNGWVSEANKVLPAAPNLPLACCGSCGTVVQPVAVLLTG